MTYFQNMADIYRRMADAGFDRKFVISVALPDSWHDTQANTDEGRQLAEESVSKAFGIELAQMLDSDGALPGSIPGGALEPNPIAFLAFRLSQLIARSIPAQGSCWLESMSAAEIHTLIVNEHRIVNLKSLTNMCWSMGLPVVAIKNYPGKKSGAATIVSQIDGQPFVALCGEQSAPGWMLWCLAESIGAVALGHMAEGQRIRKDLLISESSQQDDTYRFATHIIQGQDSPAITGHDRITGVKLSQLANQTARERGLDAGALVVGFALEKSLAGVNAKGPTNRALRTLGVSQGGVTTVNRILFEQLNIDSLNTYEQRFLSNIAEVSP